MAWEFEKVHETAVPSAPNHMAFDGRYLWVSGANTVYVYEFFGESSGHEPKFEDLDSLTIGKYDPKFKLIDTIAVASGSTWIAIGYTNIYVGDKDQMTNLTLIDIKTRKISKIVACPEQMNSNMIAENGKIWMASKSADKASDRQKLYAYNNTTSTWSFAEIPTKKQLAKIDICSGRNGSIYVTNYNNFAISKFDSTTGAFQKSIRVNAYPQKLTVTSDKVLYVSSFAGMLSRVNTADDTVTNPHSTLDVAKFGLCPEPGTSKIWFVTSDERICRLNTTDNSVMLSKLPDGTDGGLSVLDDWELSAAKFTDRAFSEMMIVNGLKYQQLINNVWTTIDVKPYMFLIGATKLMAVRLDRPIYRDLDISIEGRAMISTGPEDYTGD